MRKEKVAIIIFAVWLIVISVFMLLLQNINLEILFVLSLIGFIIIVEFIKPKYVQPRSLRYIWYLLALGIAIFGVIVVLKVMNVLGQ
jgi:hypothetical protein